MTEVSQCQTPIGRRCIVLRPPTRVRARRLTIRTVRDSPVGAASETQQASTPTSSPASSPSSDDNDPDRPVLSHGNKPAGASTKTATTSASTVTSTSATKAASPSAVAAKSATPSPGTPVRFYPAISDAGTYTNRSFLYPMTPEDAAESSGPAGDGDGPYCAPSPPSVPARKYPKPPA